MSVALILAEGIGALLASVARARGKNAAASVIESTQQLATSTMGAVEAHIEANKDTEVSVEEFRAKVEDTKATALATGDEAQARLDARKDTE